MSWETIDQGGGMTVYTGEGGGRILFLNGQCKGAQSDPLPPDLGDLEALHGAGLAGDPKPFRRMDERLRKAQTAARKMEKVMAQVEPMIDRIEAGGDADFNSPEYMTACKAFETKGDDLKLDILLCAIGSAARLHGRVPSVEEVAEVYPDIVFPKFQGLEYSDDPSGNDIVFGKVSTREATGNMKPITQKNGKLIVPETEKWLRLDGFKKRLAALGFGWLPHRRRGETGRGR